jgi:LysM repeat protein
MMRRLIFLLILAALVAGGLALDTGPVKAQTYETVVVQQGDTLAKIAARYCTTWQEIYQINWGAIGNNPNVLEAGTVLTVPNYCSNGGSSGGAGGGSGIYDRGPRTHASGDFNSPYYTVAWGDTLTSIGQRFGVSVAALKQANNLRGNGIYNGQVLYIPGIDRPTPPQPDAERVQFTPGAVAATRSASLSTGAVKRYVLEARAGQTMQVILNNYGAPLPVTISGPGATPYSAPARSTTSQTTVQTTLPTSGDYVVAIGPAGQPTSFTVTFVIQ